MRLRARCALVVLAAALAAGAGAADAAALEAPFFKVAGARLEPGQSRELKFKDSTEYKFGFAGNPRITMSCPQMSALSGAKIVGATVEATLNFGECSATGFGEGCKVAIKTTPLVGTLVFSGEKGGPIDVLFRTVSGKIIIVVKFVSKCNTGGEFFVEGTALAAEALGSKNEKIYTGEEPPEARIAHLGFPSLRISTVWEAEKVGKEEKLKEVKIKEMTAFAEIFYIVGASEWSLVKEEVWGIYT